MLYFKITYSYNDSKSLSALQEITKRLLSIQNHKGMCVYTKKLDMGNPFESVKKIVSQGSFYFICEDSKRSFFSDLLSKYNAQELDGKPALDSFEPSIGDSNAIVNM